MQAVFLIGLQGQVINWVGGLKSPDFVLQSSQPSTDGLSTQNSVTVCSCWQALHTAVLEVQQSLLLGEEVGEVVGDGVATDVGDTVGTGVGANVQASTSIHVS
jgi:hypothetical protein